MWCCRLTAVDVMLLDSKVLKVLVNRDLCWIILMWSLRIELYTAVYMNRPFSTYCFFKRKCKDYWLFVNGIMLEDVVNIVKKMHCRNQCHEAYNGMQRPENTSFPQQVRPARIASYIDLRMENVNAIIVKYSSCTKYWRGAGNWIDRCLNRSNTPLHDRPPLQWAAVTSLHSFTCIFPPLLYGVCRKRSMIIWLVE